jgi:hypothetical protein
MFGEKGRGELSPRWGRGGVFLVESGEVGGVPAAGLEHEVTGWCGAEGGLCGSAERILTPDLRRATGIGRLWRAGGGGGSRGDARNDGGHRRRVRGARPEGARRDGRRAGGWQFESQRTSVWSRTGLEGTETEPNQYY